MNTQHTPGPWVACLYEDGSPEVMAADLVDGKPIIRDQWVCRLGDSDVAESDDEMEANAHLIAAAPQLLAACRAIIAAHYGDGGYREGGDYVDDIREAVELAESAVAAATITGLPT